MFLFHKRLLSYVHSRLIPATILALVACATGFAQGGVGSSRGLPSSNEGSNTIQGKVYFPDPKADKHIKVKLVSSDGLYQSTSTNEDGIFIFNSLPPGHYQVTVEGGNQYDSVSDRVDIDQEASPGGRIMNVALSLKPKGAADAYAKIPKQAREAYAQGMEAVNANDTKKAAELFKKAVDAYPEFGPAQSELGAQYLKLGELDKAVESLQVAIKIDPTDNQAALNLGIALMNKKDFTAAEKQLRQVIVKDDKSAAAHTYLGVTLASLKQSDGAEKELKIAVSLPGGDKIALAHKYLGGIYWQKGQKQQAADELEKYVTLNPKAPDAERIRDTIKNLRANP